MVNPEVSNTAAGNFESCNWLVAQIPDSTSSERFWGPITAVSSILWLGLRTDALFPVWFEWAVFCIWTISYMVYIDQQAKAVRPRREKTFVLVVFVVAIVFIGLIAVIFRQQARHVFTSLPLCLAFSTFGVSYGFGAGSRDLGNAGRRASDLQENAFGNGLSP